MKRKTIVKLILLAFLILMLGIWKATPCLAVYSWDTDIEDKINILNGGGKIKITSEVLKNSDYIFCRERGAILQETNFFMDSSVKPNPKTYPIIKYKNQEGKDCGFEDATSVTVLGADIAYALGTYEKGSKTGDGYVDNQWVYWALLNEYKNNGEMQAEIPTANDVEYANLSYTAKKLYHESKAYQKYVQNVEEFKIKYKQKDYSPVIIPKENANISYEINNDGETIAKVGPIIIDYARVWDSYELNKDPEKPDKKEKNYISFGTITLQFEKANGEKLKGTDLGIEEEQDNTDAITFQFKKDENIQTENAKIEKLRDNNQIQKGNIYTDTSEITTNNELYINLNLNKFLAKGISELSLYVSTEMGQKEVIIYYLQGENVKLTNTSDPYYCLNCQGEEKKVIGTRVTRYEGKQDNIKEYYNLDTFKQTGRKIEGIKETNTYYKCSNCEILISDSRSMSLHIKYDHKAKGQEAKSSQVIKEEWKYVQKTYRNKKRVWGKNSGI